MDLTFDTSVLATFALLWLAIVPTPGANSLLVTHTAVTRPAHAVALVIAGNMVGILFLGAGALLGWAAVLEAVPSLRRAVTVAGGAYLVYLGARLLLQRLAAATKAVANTSADDAADQPVTAISARRQIGLGFVTALSNAQAHQHLCACGRAAGQRRDEACNCWHHDRLQCELPVAARLAVPACYGAARILPRTRMA